MHKPLALLALAALATAAPAQILFEASASAYAGGPVYEGSSASASSDWGNASAWAGGGGTVVRTYASVTADDAGSVTAGASARAFDWLTPTSTSHAGEWGTFTMQVSVHGFFSGTYAESQTYKGTRWWDDRGLYVDNRLELSIGYLAGMDVRQSIRQTPNHPEGSRDDSFGLYDIEVPFVFGERISMFCQATSSVGILCGSGVAEADFSHTFRFLGVTAVRDAQGNAVTDFTMPSDSGVDYVHPQAVPEPAPILALAVGAAGLLRRRRLSLKRP